MKYGFSLFASLLVLMVTLSSCEVVGGIFKAGFWTAIVLIVLVIIVIIWLMNRFRRR